MINHCVTGREFLEGQREGAFAETLAYCLERGGVVHFSRDCLLMGVPCEDAPEVLHVVYQHSHLPALRRVLLALPYERVRWRRDWGHGERYGVRERAIADFCRHDDYGTGLTK
ncbi:MAG: hypothetical protein IJN29_05320 [Akkermansia sp.]|nr:hypothetical protein [Akkermansia sp.]